MQRYLFSGWILLSLCFLTACSSYREVKFTHDLTRETWMQEVETDPAKWARGTDSWFLTGDAHATEVPDHYMTPITTMKVNAPIFSKIQTKGDFKVQIFGTESVNTVYVYGPNEAVSGTVITVKGDTLYLSQRKGVSQDIRRVIIRIGVNRLNGLTQLGRGMVEGVRLNSDHLTVISAGSGNVYLAGHMNLSLLQNLSTGSVSVFGANTPELDIRSSGCGTTNVSGNVGVRSIIHQGSANINVIGANSNQLIIDASGSGKVGISGIVNLCVVKASNNVSVYVCRVSSANLHATAKDNARIGLAGFAQNLYVDAYQNTCVGARNVCADAAYVHATGRAHVNVAAGKKIFAASKGSSSIYFFGPSDILTRFVSENGFIMHICTAENNCPVLQQVNLPYAKAEPVMLRGAG